MNSRKIIAALFVVIASICNVTAQNTGCDSDDLNNTLLQTDPVFHRNFQYMEQMLRQNEGLDESQRSTEVYSLPVVVHVIHTGNPYGNGTNITDEQIYSAIDALNEDYRHIAGTNGDGAGPDIGIEFCLAARDPNGQPSNGIVRVNGSNVPNYATQGIEASGGNGAVEESVKALSTWPRASYLNIWVVNEIENNDGGSGIQGYAYFPINNPIDGIVILYNAIGTVGELKSYTNMNRVLTHEVGHYLGLYHTFNATNACGAESDCTTAGDRVCDTPPTIQSSNCSVPACSGTQQVENYLDYTQQTCQDMFTEGQKLRMRTTLETQRASMITSLGCMPVYTTDIGITTVLNPTGTICLGAISPQVTLTNFGSNTLTSATIQYNLDAVGSTNYSWTGSLASGSSATVTLGTINPTSGAHTLYAWTTNPNGTTDQNSSNNQATGDFSISAGAAATLDVVTDYFGSETTWKIFDENDFEILNGGPYANGTQGAHNLEPICLPAGCYTLTMYDQYGDGQGFTAGSFSLTSSTGTVLVSGANNWGSQSANPFCLIESTPTGNPPVASFTIQDNTLCKNVQNDYTNTSTNSPTTYAWTFEGGTPATSTQASPQNVTYAVAGVFDVTLTVTNADGNNTFTCSNCVTVNADPTVTVSGTNPLCNTSANGSITSTVTGTNPIGYSWSNGATTANITSLGAGTYTLTATDANGCSKQGSATLVAPSAITITGTATNATCAGQNNGSITVSASGGTGTKTFSWSNGATGATISNLAAGTYTVTATDANGCTKTQPYTITVPSAIAITGTATATSCSGSNGSITVSATGGTGTKTFTWSNGATGATISNLAAGSYIVTAHDANNCTATQTYTVTSPANIVITGTATNITCSGTNNGSISVSATGGTGNKTFSWSNGATGASISNLAAGNYTVTATDAAGCTQTQIFTIISPTAIIISGTATNVTCSGANNGTITVSASGGTGTKTFSWSNGATGATISNLAAGSFTVTATDANGCIITQTYSITTPTAISVSGTATNPTCNGVNNGTINVSASGGTGNKTFNWSNGATGSTISNLTAGAYTVTATDVNGCVSTQSYTLVAPTAIVITGSVTNVSCYAGTNGSISVSATGGTGTKTFSWNNGQTGASISNLSAGSYIATATDLNSCTSTQTYSVTAPVVLISNLTDFDIACNDAFGSAQVSPTGGTSPYSIAWSNGNSGNNSGNLDAGAYSVSVTDSHGCIANGNFDITQSASLNVYTNASPISCYGLGDGSISLNVSGGNSNYTYLWSNGATTPSISNLIAGTYGVIVTDGNGCQGSSEALIIEPSALIATVESDDVSCNGLADGIANVMADGGTAPYAYEWSHGATTSSVIDLQPGTFMVNISDANGCIQSQSVIISEPIMLIASVIILSPESCTGNDGSAEVTVEGGTPGYFTQWSDGSNNAELSGAAAGNYSVAVTDANGCILNLDVEIPYDCEANISATQLIDADCNAVNIALNSILTCDEVAGASMYQWRFCTVGGSIISDEYSLGNMFYTSQIPNVAEGTIYIIKVKALVASNWGPFGESCSITTHLPEQLITGLSSEDCGSTVTSWGETLTAIEIPDVLNYQWHITGVDYDWTTYTATNVLTLESSMQLVPGSTYEVQLRCAIGSGQFTDWSSSCEFSMAQVISVTEIEGNGFLLIYPNPGDGEKIYFDLGNLKENVLVENLELYGPTGSLVEKFNINLAPGNNKTYEHYFMNKLASGMYVLRYKLNGHDSEEKLIVR